MIIIIIMMMMMMIIMIIIIIIMIIIIIIIQWNLRLRPPLVSDHLSSATSFPKYQKFPSQITAFGTSCKRPPLVSDRDRF